MTTLPNRSRQLLEPSPNQPFSIQEPDSVWIVQSGKLDLFLLRENDGQPAGARHHFLRLVAGQAAFGMGKVEDCHTAVIATATPDTQLLRLSRDALQAESRADVSNVYDDALPLLEEWIINLGRAAAMGTSAPITFALPDTSAIVEVGDNPKPILQVKGVTWITHLGGESRFLNSSDGGQIGGHGYFPVSRFGWLQAAPGSRIQAVDSSHWQRSDPEWSAVEIFHEVILRKLLSNREIAEERSKSRLRLQAASDAVIVRNALQSLASPLQGSGSEIPADDPHGNDPTLRSCEIIGKRLDVTIACPLLRSDGIVSTKDYVAAIAKASDLRHRVVVLKGKWWINSSGPLLAFRESNSQPVALVPAANNGFELHDPVLKTTVKVSPAVALSLNGFAYTFYRPLPATQLSLWDVLRFAFRDTKRELLTILTMGVCAGLLDMVFPIATGIIFDSVIPGAQRGQLLQICAMLVLATLGASMFMIVRNLAMLRLEGKMGSSLQAAVWDRLLRLPVPFFRRYTSGDLADRSSGIGSILRILTGSAVFSILSGVFSIFSFALLFYYSWQLALVAWALVLVIFVRSGLSIYFEVQSQRQIAQVRGRISGMLLELIGNIARLRVSGAEPRAFAAWAKEFAGQVRVRVQAEKTASNLAVFNAAFPVISLAILFSCAAQLMGHPLLHALTTGTFLAFLAAFGQFQGAALGMSSAIESALGVIPLYTRAGPIFETLPEVAKANRAPGNLTGAIELNHVSFRYHAEMPLVLNDISLSIKPGQFIAIVGPSGSGKSSLLRLLLGFEKPEAGSIYFDGQDLTGLDIQTVRSQMGVVLQSARLSSGSIFENIIGSGPFTLDDAWEAARSAGMEKDIREMPMGMHTVVSEGGANISGGQRQRLLIARAMVKKPRIFLFDEATSALDNQTQAIVSHSLDGFSATRIVVAHRLSTIVNADHIFVVEKGIIVQSGTSAELTTVDGLFRELAKRQIT